MKILNNKISLFLSILAIFFMVSCSDSDEKDEQSGNQTGNQSGNQTGNQSGDQTGNQSGDQTGNAECTDSDLSSCVDETSYKVCENGHWETKSCEEGKSCRSGQCRVHYADEEIDNGVKDACAHADSCYAEFSDYECANGCTYYTITVGAMTGENTAEACESRAKYLLDQYKDCHDIYMDMVTCRGKSSCVELKLCKGVDMGTDSDVCKRELDAWNACMNGRK